MSDKIAVQNEAACNKLCHVIGPQDLPFACPSQDARLWDAHPRVYLPIEAEGEVICPYCGTKYLLEKSTT